MASGPDLIHYSDFDRKRGIRYHRKALARADARSAKYAAAAAYRSVGRYEVKRLALFGWHATAASAVDQRSVPAREPPEIPIPIGAWILPECGGQGHFPG